MKTKLLIGTFLAVAIVFFGLINVSFAQMQSQDEARDCETCPMKVDSEALAHFYVLDGNGTQHYVECIGCALKLLKTCDTLHIETYCDWYGPEYKIAIDISSNGAETTVNPASAVTIVGGGCTGNRVAYNQTAAEALLVNGYSDYTMKMMKQDLPSNANITSVSTRAAAFAIAASEQSTPQLPLIPILAVAGIAVIVGSLVAYKKLKH